VPRSVRIRPCPTLASPSDQGGRRRDELDGGTAGHGGAGFEAITLLRSRVRDRRTYVVLTSRAVTVESLDDRLRRAWLKGGPQ
jgi:hypothetical protein